MTYSRRTDGNHADIRDALRQVGAWVSDTHNIGDGFPDLVVAKPNGYLFMVEVKASRSSKLTEDERKFATECPAHVHIVYSVEDALSLYQTLGW